MGSLLLIQWVFLSAVCPFKCSHILSVIDKVFIPFFVNLQATTHLVHSKWKLCLFNEIIFPCIHLSIWCASLEILRTWKADVLSHLYLFYPPTTCWKPLLRSSYVPVFLLCLLLTNGMTQGTWGKKIAFDQPSHS